ncbi:MAG: molybdopterin-dependent oxidoreductase [candidate division KSB1 bacterium]|nr:molybdopterin-dependent oxidoreductase [candidate division KSB1 bacterium]MDZ7273656.1 molybdopterin-dependent oxidoreductase [candidate division KSB1 bacterium]MDZ7285812.1 molybdopterin-dependent oxidoreductase [candidate division KSB1 bacterium]MDZ7298844.1 molybdopterin-dependent oxidoreductase [candidate division KSB1 bacterium]MDZ7308565.1 molybdopterin-dependent oxidoreductase [candidate division KSB1 bacterium]
MSSKLSRRDFIKISGLGLGAAAAGGGALKALFEANRHDMPTVPALTGFRNGPVTLTPTVCEICFWQCAGWVHTVNGQPWKITGNPADPNCNGRLCPRGTGGLGAYLDADRLRTPLIRTEVRGRQKFREASWEEAFAYIADKMKKIAAEHGPECLALFTHGSGGAYFKHLLRAFGSDNVAAPSYAQCRGPREEAYMLTFGDEIGSPERTDMQNTRCLVLIGSHLGENMHNTQVQEFAEAVANGATVITVDPRFSVAASKSKYWLPIRPATDTALLLAWIHVIIEEELYDREYVEKYTVGFAELKAAVQHNTPEWAHPITTIPPEVIRQTAREMARHRPATLVHPGRHVTWYGDDTQRVRAGAILNALLGSWGRRGGFYFPNKAEVPAYPHPPYPRPKRTWRDAFPDKYPLANLALANGICEATIPSATRDCNFKGWIVYGTNLMLTLPEPQKTITAIQHLDLLVVIDIMPAEITGWADVVLPECSYLERYDDLRILPGRVPSIALRAPAFAPRFNSKPAWWMAKELARHLGLEAYFPWQNFEEYLEARLRPLGTSLAEMKKKGVLVLENQRQPLYLAEGAAHVFDTPSGKIELASSQLAEMGFDAVPKYQPHEEPPEGYYRLIYGRAPTHTFGRTTNNPILAETMSENEVWVNPVVARRNGIHNGDYVVLVNQDGVRSNKVKAKVTERIRHDCVYLVHGFGHTDRRMRRTYLRGADDTGLMTRVKIDPIMGGTGMRVNFVTLETAST